MLHFDFARGLLGAARELGRPGVGRDRELLGISNQQANRKTGLLDGQPHRAVQAIDARKRAGDFGAVGIAKPGHRTLDVSRVGGHPLISGLLHRADLSRGRIFHPLQVAGIFVPLAPFFGSLEFRPALLQAELGPR